MWMVSLVLTANLWLTPASFAALHLGFISGCGMVCSLTMDQKAQGNTN
jgi:hypothetical protein